MNIYRVRKTIFGRCILQAYRKAINPEFCGWFDVPYCKAPTRLKEHHLDEIELNEESE